MDFRTSCIFSFLILLTVGSFVVGQTSPCTPNPCLRDCVCLESCQHAGGYFCRSASGYLGKNCTTPIPTLRCEVDRMVFSVSESFVMEYDLGLKNSFVNVAPDLQSRGCEVLRAVNGYYEIQIPLPFTACGTRPTVGTSTPTFSNQMWFNRRLSNSMFDMPIPVASFQCQYKRQYDVVTSIRPLITTPNVISGKNFITPTISLCKSPTCPSFCPDNLAVKDGAIYTVGEMVHVSMSLDSGDGVTGIDSMSLSCSPSAMTSNAIELISDGCVVSIGLPANIGTSAAGHVVCVSFQTPRTLSCQEFYIHTKLQSCDRMAVMTCAGAPATSKCSSSRRRRSFQPSPVVVGPVWILNGSIGLPTIQINGMESDDEIALALEVPVPKSEQASIAEDPLPRDSGIPVFIIALSTIAAVLLLISFTFLVFVLRSRLCNK